MSAHPKQDVARMKKPWSEWMKLQKDKVLVKKRNEKKVNGG